MTSVGLRLNLRPDMLARLITFVANKFGHFVRIGPTQPVGLFHQVDIRILNAYELRSVDDVNEVPVTREMVGELFDLLDIFPRINQDDGEHSKILAEIRQNLGAIWSKSGSPTAPWLRQPLKRIEELLISLEKV